ncbi:unnamed protein product [Chironomus riparius]|uniref:Uncharacterized protein n=1 Tax=Chironomus riparius TaxID=315576 RepID=A0A9N9RLW4_9DIPT|nr:unnamed protein product [Chironomus riparius]
MQFIKIKRTLLSRINLKWCLYLQISLFFVQYLIFYTIRQNSNNTEKTIKALTDQEDHIQNKDLQDKIDWEDTRFIESNEEFLLSYRTTYFVAFSIQHPDSRKCLSLYQFNNDANIVLGNCGPDLSSIKGSDDILTLEKSIRYNDINDECTMG